MNNEKSTASLTIAANTKKKEKSYWLNQLSGQPQKSSFPFDYENNRYSLYRLETIHFSLPEGIARQFIDLSKGSNARLFIFLIAGIFILLRKYTGNKDILLGIPVSRPREDIELLNPALAIRYFFDDTLSFPQLLSKLGQILIEAENHQNFPVRVLSDLLELPWSPGEGFPLFDVVVSLKNIHQDTLHEFSPNIMVAFENIGKRIECKFSYNPQRYRSDAIARLINHYQALLGTVLAKPHKKIADIELLSNEEKHQILLSFNDTTADFPESTTVHELIDRQAELFPQADAVVYKDQRLSYAELKNKTDCLAVELRQRGLGPDQIAAVIINHIPEMIVALVGILKSGAAYLPIDPDYPPERINYILKDSRALAVIDKKFFGGPGGDFSKKPPGRRRHFYHSSQLAYIIYTSGSTGRPKGVMIQHKSFIDFTTWAVDEFEHRVGYQVLLSNSYASDGSIQQIFPPLISGGTLHLIDKELRLDVARYLDYLKKNKINNIDEVPVLMKELIAQIDPNDREEKLPDLTCLSLGSEYVPIDLVKKCRQHLNHHGRIINAYGPAEASVETATYHCDGTSDDEQSLIGKPRRNIQVYILDEAGHCCPIGARGEICISGLGLARGYLNQPELTAERFILPSATRNPFEKGFPGPSQNFCLDKDFSGGPGGRFFKKAPLVYRTGDRGCWLPDGNIRFFGRIDDQIKIRGYRVELLEIENVLKSHKEIKDAVVLTRENKSGEIEIYAYYIPKPGAKPSLREYIEARLPSYMRPSYLMELEKIPLTPNGKVDKNALPEPAADSTDEYLPPRNDIEKKLVDVWSEVLNRSSETIGVHADFFKLGGHSLKVAVLTSRIQKQLEVAMPIIQVFKTPTISGLAEYLKTAGKSKYTSIEPVELKEYYDLTPVQKRLYILQQMSPGSPAYNVHGTITLDKRIGKERLEEIFKKIIQRHEILRTSYEMHHDEPMQKVHDNVEFEIEILGRGDPVWSFIRPFDLSKAPLMRVGLIKEEEDKYILVVDMHHIICDPISHEVLAGEFKALCNDEELPGLKIQYKDYAGWQNSETQKAKTNQQGNYWLNLFNGELPVLELPVDFPRPQIQDFEGASVDFILGRKDTLRLKNAVRRHHVTLYMITLAAFNILLSKLGRQEDIIVGTPISTRQHEDIEKMIGMFVNTLALRNEPAGHKTFSDFLQEIKIKTLAAYSNADYPFEELVEKIAVNRDTGRNPLFDVMFNHLQDSGGIPTGVAEEEKNKLNPHGKSTSKFDISLTAVEYDDNLLFNIEYCTRLFKAETIDRIAGYFKKIITSIIEDPGKQVSEIEIISEVEMKRILFDFNDNKKTYPQGKTIHQLFEEQVERTPDNIAVFGRGRTRMNTANNRSMAITYCHLNQQSGRLAHLLIKKGVLADNIVGIMTERSIEMIIGIIGILKSGGAYMPINQDYPQERIEYMMKDSATQILLTANEISSLLMGCDSNFHSSSFLIHHSNQLAYIIYTSGSTGKPKGVPIEHRCVNNLVWGLKERIYKRHADFLNVILVAPFVFDSSVQQIFGALLQGHALHVATEESRVDGAKLTQYFRDYQIDISDGTPTHIRIILESLQDKPADFKIKHFIIAGETLPPGIVKRFLGHFKENPPLLSNLYGPTETCVDSTSYDIQPETVHDFNTIPIGKPLPNEQVYILDTHFGLQPVGVPGELCISGDGLARGYVNNPELTAEKFIYFHHSSFDLPRIHYSKLYRTGDLARWLSDGNIEFLDRIDHQVKIRGFRIELGEIESRITKYPGIKEAVVLMQEEEKGDKYLCAYVVSEENVISKLREFLSMGLPDYMIPAYFVPLEKIPLTINGKINRKALPKPELKVGDSYIAPRNEVEKKLVEFWTEILSRDEWQASQLKTSIGIHDNFFQLGGHSLKAIRLANKIQKSFGVKIVIQTLFQFPTIAEMAGIISKSNNCGLEEIEKLPGKPYYEMSYSQKRLWYINQNHPQETVFNMPTKLTLYESVTKEVILNVLQQLMIRHQSLRTYFKNHEEGPVQAIESQDAALLKLNLEVLDLTPLDQAERENERLRLLMEESSYIFNLEQSPLFRAKLVKCTEKEYDFIFNIHHIVSDGWSLEILKKEFYQFYECYKKGIRCNLEPLEIQYKDYAAWQNQLLNDQEKMAKAKEFWKNYLTDANSDLNLPYDSSIGALNTKKSSAYCFLIDEDIAERLHFLAGEQKSTLFIVLLAAFNILLAHITCQENILVGIPAAARQHWNLQNIVGLFVNTLILKSKVNVKENFNDFLARFQADTFNVLEYQGFPLEIIFGELKIKYPEISAFFNMLNIGSSSDERIKIFASYHTEEIQETQFALHCYLTQYKNAIQIECHYFRELFTPETIEKIMQIYQRILENISASSLKKIKELTRKMEKLNHKEQN